MINGEEVMVPNSLESITDLLKHLNLHDQVVIAEVNEDIIDNQKQSETQIKENDKIELVRFVGGG
ncbi:sulfur carrier protein ThiS [Fictibacillus nanhaiensis]|uniref:sulfur carrier protein ThiS n=1 Tax=Fictibacillus nanhaiensis TaxID=742169 RepID=UPI002E239F62|nr:sulfur carrier protein ThiS [Fictibacillus nanhaiensis]MED1862687.1 sulfur carrier protein ThiS [Fictibacillus nanhaiensis]